MSDFKAKMHQFRFLLGELTAYLRGGERKGKVRWRGREEAVKSVKPKTSKVASLPLAIVINSPVTGSDHQAGCRSQ